MTTATETRTAWRLRGKGYEFCSCNPGCTCNFIGFPSTADGGCHAVVGNVIDSGSCGDIDLSGITVAAIIDWPKAIHEGGGKVVFAVPPEVTDEQVGVLAQIYTGALGGMPWEIIGTTYEVAGLVRAPVTITANGLESNVTIEGVGQATGRYLSNPVTGERNEAHIVLPDGFFWKKGECGIGSFHVKTDAFTLDWTDTSWILYDFDWSN